MHCHAVGYTLLHRRGSRAFFLLGTTRHVRSARAAREVGRALAALAALIGWAGVALLFGS
jgi:hypothetical protein